MRTVLRARAYLHGVKAVTVGMGWQGSPIGRRDEWAVDFKSKQRVGAGGVPPEFSVLEFDMVGTLAFCTPGRGDRHTQECQDSCC